MATKEYLETMRWKFPNLLFSMMKDVHYGKICHVMEIDESTFLDYLSAYDFPTDNKLKKFCDEFKLSYSTLKTWKVNDDKN